MERDLSNIKFDFEKFTSSLEDVKQGLNERLRQWSDYETQLEKLTAWLTDSENVLKNYTYKASLEEKQEQLEKFKVNAVFLGVGQTENIDFNPLISRRVIEYNFRINNESLSQKGRIFKTLLL